MSTHNIQFHDKMRKFPLIFVFLSYRKNFVGTQKRARIIEGKRAIGVLVIEVSLYFLRTDEGERREMNEQIKQKCSHVFYNKYGFKPHCV